MKNKEELLKIPKAQLEKGKHGLLNIVFGRTGIIILIAAVQIAFLLVGFQFLGRYVFATYWGAELFALILVVHVISKRGNPAFKIAWIVPMLSIPVFGTLFYLFFNTQFECLALNKKIRAEDERTADLAEQRPEVLERLEADSRQMANLASYLRKAGGSSIHQNTETEYFPCGEAAMDTLLTGLRNAKKFIFLEYFIISKGYMWDAILEILKMKAKEGVEVRLLYDGMNGLYRLPKDYPQELEKEGIRCRVFAPVRPALSTIQNNRDHRKILVIDGHTAFTGGINLADEYINRKERFGYWKDNAIMFKGDAVRSFTLLFLRMWNVVDRAKEPGEYRKYLDVPVPEMENADEGYVMPYCDNPLDTDQVGECVYLDIFNTAKDYIHIMTPYLVLDHETVVALTYAAKRGVDVKIIMPHIPDKKYAFILARSYYNELLDAGVKIYEFLPGFVHSKTIVSDDEKAVVGSINMDYRSLYLSFECAALMYRSDAVAAVEKDIQDTLAQCMTVTKDVYNKQNVLIKAASKVLRLFAPLM